MIITVYEQTTDVTVSENITQVVLQDSTVIAQRGEPGAPGSASTVPGPKGDKGDPGDPASAGGEDRQLQFNDADEFGGSDAYYTTSYNYGFGTPTPKGKIDSYSDDQYLPRVVLSGKEFFQGQTSLDGFALLLGVNREGNRQCWFANTDKLDKNSTNVVIRIWPNTGDGAGVIDAIATDGVTLKPLLLNPNASPVGVGLITGLDYKLNVLETMGIYNSNGGGERVAFAANAGTPRMNLIKNGLSAGFQYDGNSFFCYTDAKPMKFQVAGQSAFYGGTDGNNGIGTDNPTSRLTIGSGDVEVSDNTRGIILKSPNGSRWRVKIDDNGDWVKTQL